MWQKAWPGITDEQVKSSPQNMCEELGEKSPMEADGSSILIMHAFIQKKKKEIEHLLCSFVPCKPSLQSLDEVFLSFPPLLRVKMGNLLGHMSPPWEGKSHCFLYGFRSPKETGEPLGKLKRSAKYRVLGNIIL